MKLMNLVALTAVLGCNSTPTPPPSIELRPTLKADGPRAPKATARTHQYSPYAVELSGHPAFHVVTFKHVGQSVPPAGDPVFEIIAESMALALSVEGGYSAEVHRDDSLLDPANHRACGVQHLYVDVWETQEAGWGYSLWSGCSVEARFAIEQAVAAPTGSLVDRVAPLTKAVHTALKAADATGCYRQAC